MNVLKSVKQTVNIYLILIKYYLCFFKPVLRKQIRNPKNIPIIINNFNQLFYLKQLINKLQIFNIKTIVILDNNSTFPPLLKYYEDIKNEVKIIRLTKNRGHLAFWKTEYVFKQYSSGFYVVTDPDVVPLDICPEDLVKKLMKLSLKYKIYTKVGVSLKINDIPDHYINKDKVLNWEKQFWQIEKSEMAFEAAIDTTFALYRPNYIYNKQNFYKALRTKKPYQAKHGGWYINHKNLTEEELYYNKTANSSSSWNIDKQNNTTSSMYN